MQHILIIRLSAIGDVMHSTCVVRNLKRFLPEARISWLVSPPADALLQGNPDVDEILIWDRHPFDRAVQSLKLLRAWQLLGEARDMLRKRHFDTVLDIQGLFLTGLLARFTDAGRRIGIHERHEGNPLFMTEMAPDVETPHKIMRYLSALLPLGWQPENFRPGLVLRLPEGHASFARKFWQAHGVDPDKRILLINLRTTWQDKQLEPAAFAKALALAKLPADVQFTFPGSASDRPYIGQTISLLEEFTCRDDPGAVPGRTIVSIAGETSLMELAALLSSSTLLLTCDTGPLYLAEAVGLETLSLWGPTLPEIYGPLSPGHHFLISPHGCLACCKTKCRHRTNACMRAIKPEMVAAKLRELLH